MKTVQSSLLGSRKIHHRTPDAILWQLAQFLKEHRAVIISRLISSLPIYLSNTFELTQLSQEQIVEIRDSLIAISDSEIGKDDFKAISVQPDNTSVLCLTNEYFYEQIKEHLKPYINSVRLKVA